MTFIYHAYGLGIKSFFPLVELPHEDAPEDVCIHFGSARPPKACTFVIKDVVYANEREVYVPDGNIANFVVSEGREIVVDPAPGVEMRRLRHRIYGHIFPLLLHQRGRLVLHGTTVAIKDKALVLLGDSGAGKSTLAMALHQQGARIVADDVCSMEIVPPRRALVFPGMPWLGLWPDAARALGDTPEALPQFATQSEKRVRHFTGASEHRTTPVAAICVLMDDVTVDTELLPRRAALLALMRNTYWFGLVPVLGGASHLSQCAHLANTVPIYRLMRSESLDALSETALALLSMVP